LARVPAGGSVAQVSNLPPRRRPAGDTADYPAALHRRAGAPAGAVRPSPVWN